MHAPIFVLIVSIFLCFAGCGSPVSSGTGSVAFSVVWQGAPTLAPGVESTPQFAPLDCAASGVNTVSAFAYSASNELLASGGPWNCSDHSGTINNVPAQSNVKVVVLAKDSSGNGLYHGEQTGVAVTAGQTTDAGTIMATIFPPMLTAPADGSAVIDGSFNFSWMNTGISYEIQVSDNFGFTSILMDATVTLTSYTPSASLNTGTYYWRVKSLDSYGNASAWSAVHNFTIAPAVPAPTSITATAGDQQNTIAWLPVAGATSYNIYWSTASGVNKTNGTKISNVTGPYTHSSPPLNNWVTYYYVVTAVNVQGESSISQEVSAVPRGVSGILDTTFNSQGWVVHKNAAGGNLDDVGRAITIDSNGRILVTGRSDNVAVHYDMVIWRYNANGTLDTTFNGRGWVVFNSAADGNSDDYGHGITIDSYGRILVTGDSNNYSVPGNSGMVIWRYNANGTLDTTFNGQGWVVNNNAGDTGYGIITDSNGRILITGRRYNGVNNDMAIWRYNSNGTLDAMFNGQGWVVHNSAAGGNDEDYGQGITTDSNGRILVTGYSFNPQGSSGMLPGMVIWRYNSDGTLDTTFNSQGWVVFNSYSGNGSAEGNGITLDSSGRILVTGSIYDTFVTNFTGMAIWRYNSNGTLDTTFNYGGIYQGVVVNNSNSAGIGDYGSGITIDSSGRILVAGRSSDVAGNDVMVVWRYNPSGIIDTNFGGQGWVVHKDAAGGYTDSNGRGITIDSSGRILVTGESFNAQGNDDMVIWRFNP